MGLTDIPADGFQPFVAFVALGAAGLVVGRLVAEMLGIALAENFVQAVRRAHRHGFTDRR